MFNSEISYQYQPTQWGSYQYQLLSTQLKQRAININSTWVALINLSTQYQLEFLNCYSSLKNLYLELFSKEIVIRGSRFSCPRTKTSETLGSSLVLESSSELKLGLWRTRNRSQNRKLDIPSLRIGTKIKILAPDLSTQILPFLHLKSAFLVYKLSLKLEWDSKSKDLESVSESESLCVTKLKIRPMSCTHFQLWYNRKRDWKMICSPLYSIFQWLLVVY